MEKMDRWKVREMESGEMDRWKKWKDGQRKGGNIEIEKIGDRVHVA